MAKKIGIELDFNTKSAEQSAESFAKEIDKATKTLGGLEEQQDELLAKLKETEIGTDEFKQLSKELNNTKSQIKDLELGFEGLDMEQRFTAATDAIGGVAGGFAAVEGAIAIAGVESAEFEQTMLRVQGAMALAMGIKDISTAVAALSKLNVAAKLAAAGQKVLNFVMSANPIGLIVVAIGALVAGFIAFSDKIKSVVMPILQPLIDAFDFVADAVEEVAANLGLIPSAAERAAKAQADAAKEARSAVINEERRKTNEVLNAEKEKRAAREDSFDFEIAKLQAAGEATFEIEQEKLQYVIDSIARQKELLREQIEFEKKVLKEKEREYGDSSVAQFNVDYQLAKVRIESKSEELEEITEQEKTAQETITLNQIREDKRRNDAAKRAAEEARKAKEAADKKAEEDKKKKEEKEKKEEEDRLARERERQKRELEQKQAFENELEQLDEERYQKSLSEEQREITQIQDKYFRLIEIAKQYGLDTTELEKAQKEELAAINKKYRDEEDAANTDALLKSIENAEAERQAKLSVAESTVAGLASLSKIAIRDSQKAEKIQKAFALAQIAIDTAKAISALVAASQQNPLNGVTVGAAGAAQFASGIATILANMAQAAALLKRPSPNVSNLSSSAGGGIAGAGVPINAVQNGSTLIGNGQPDREVNKVVVVESDITSTQQGISQIQSQATVVE